LLDLQLLLAELELVLLGRRPARLGRDLRPLRVEPPRQLEPELLLLLVELALLAQQPQLALPRLAKLRVLLLDTRGEVGERGRDLLLGATLQRGLAGGLRLLELATERRLLRGHLARELRRELLLDLVRDHLGERDVRPAARASDRIGHGVEDP